MGVNSNSDTKILITGASGFIGARVSSHLLSCGYDVYSLSRDFGGGYIQGDFGDKERMGEVLSEVKPDIIIHCAGVTPHKNVEDKDYDNINFEASRRLLGIACDRNIFFINASTIGVYGQPVSHDGVVRETDACSPLSPYAQSKYDFEKVLSQSDISYINIRIANIPGRDAFINYALNNESVQFNGNEPYVRDYIHLDDLVSLFEKSVQHLVKGGEGFTANAGSGVGLSFPDIVNEIERQTGAGVERVKADGKTGDVIKIICDISTAKHELGWEPAYTNLKDIIEYALRNKTL